MPSECSRLEQEILNLKKRIRELEAENSEAARIRERFNSIFKHTPNSLTTAEHLLAILESTSDLVSYSSTDGKVAYINQAGKKLLGIAANSDVSQVSIKDCHPERVAEKIINQAIPAAIKEGIWQGEAIVLSASGKEIPVSQVIMAHKSATGEIDYISTIVRDITRQRQYEEKLIEYQEQLRSLSLTISRVAQEARRKIAVGLHDEVAQLLVNCKMKLAAAEKKTESPEQSSLLRAAARLLESCINKTRTLIFEISPPILYDLGLEAALEWYAEQFSKQNNIRCQVARDGRNAQISPESAQFIFQSVRELLSNISKHSTADKVSITIAHDERSIEVSVSDNGKGFDPAAKGPSMADLSGFGLFSIKEQARFFGASFSIESAPGEGCSAVLTLPTV